MSTHIRCRITPILRAKATLACFVPRRFATSIPQRLSAENRVNSRQQNTGRFVECGAHHLIAGACDAARHVSFPRLVFLRRQSE